MVERYSQDDYLKLLTGDEESFLIVSTSVVKYFNKLEKDLNDRMKESEDKFEIMGLTNQLHLTKKIREDLMKMK